MNKGEDKSVVAKALAQGSVLGKKSSSRSPGPNSKDPAQSGVKSLVNAHDLQADDDSHTNTATAFDAKGALDMALDPKSTSAGPSKQARPTITSKDNVKVVIRVRPMNEKESKYLSNTLIQY